MVFTVEIIFVVIIGSIGNGTLTLTGEATGAKDNKLYRSIVKTSIMWAFLVCGFALLFISIFPRFTLSLFTTDKEVIEMSVVYIILVAVNLFGKSGNIIFGNGIRGYGDTKWMLFTQILGTFSVVGLAALFVFVFKLGMLGVFIAVLCDEGSRALINFARFSRIKF
jgi:Na+-driven multidrug efflux pump